MYAQPHNKHINIIKSKIKKIICMKNMRKITYNFKSQTNPKLNHTSLSLQSIRRQIKMSANTILLQLHQVIGFCIVKIMSCDLLICYSSNIV